MMPDHEEGFRGEPWLKVPMFTDTAVRPVDHVVTPCRGVTSQSPTPYRRSRCEAAHCLRKSLHRFGAMPCRPLRR
jgi:hypothetical protein